MYIFYKCLCIGYGKLFSLLSFWAEKHLAISGRVNQIRVTYVLATFLSYHPRITKKGKVTN